MTNAFLTALHSADFNYLHNTYYLIGDWTKVNVPALQKKIQQKHSLAGRKAVVDANELTHLDTAGAILFRQFIAAASERWLSVEILGLAVEHQALLDLIASKEETIRHAPKPPQKASFFHVVGQEVFTKIWQIDLYLAFAGQFFFMFFHSIKNFSALQSRSFLNSIEEMGYRALPIIALLSFLIGVVIAYQLGIQLQNYGADVFIVNLVGQAIFREFGPLITAIIGAGRTSSAITAKIGTMKINQELDALKTMGFSPFDILVIPRVFAAVVAFPLLMIWADIFGVLGGMMMTKVFFGIQYGDFLGRFRDIVPVNTLLMGLAKAPAFAVIIAMVGCFQGFRVTTGADSVGIQTTKSVVQSIFLIILADAAYSIVYSKLNM